MKNDKIVQCDHCSEWIAESNLIKTGTGNFCRLCCKRYECGRCRYEYSNYELLYHLDSGEYYCEDCREQLGV